MRKNSRIYIAGHNGLVGSALVSVLQKNGYANIITKSHDELHLDDTQQTSAFFEQYKPEYVFCAAAKVGGISANNKYPADFIYQNLMIQTNLIHQSYLNKVTKLLFLGSSCIYPKESVVPIQEEELLKGYLEKTNESYAIAKIAGIKMCEAYNKQYGTNYVAVMPTNLYGPRDNFNPETSHVLPALIHKIHTAKINNQKEVVLWGTGTPKREFLYVDDMAEACVFVMNKFDYDPTKRIYLNIGTGCDISIEAIASIIARELAYNGTIVWDTTKPDGTMRKVLDVSKINSLGWKARVTLLTGIKKTIQYYHSLNSNQ